MRPVGIIGAGFTGLTAAISLLKLGRPVAVFEADSDVGGLAGGFRVSGGHTLEKFYHHWFTTDRHVMDLVRELGEERRIIERATRTGMYYSNARYRLSTPLDVLRFRPLSLRSRLRLGLLLFQVRRVTDWRSIEHLSAREWLVSLCGDEVYSTVWEPLIRAKFSIYADDLSAAWFWKKLALRGSSRGRMGGEMLAYYRGGFATLANRMRDEIVALGGEVHLSEGVQGISVSRGAVESIRTSARDVGVSAVVATPALPIIADILQGAVDPAYPRSLRRVNYLGNRCLVLELDRSLSDTYWLNVNDPNFPFVGVIEHTNFEPPQSYGGRHIVYLSRYSPHTDPVYGMDTTELFEYAEPHIARMFPEFRREWVEQVHSWTARYAQPVMERSYSDYVPAHETPLSNLWISTMAQIYPEDRGTNYAVREGQKIAGKVHERMA